MSKTNASTKKLLTGAMLLGAIGIVVAYFQAGLERFWANWLLWFVLFFTVGLGCLFVVALEHLTNARWSVPIRRVPERLATLLIPTVPIGLIALGALKVLYPGTRPEALQNKVLAGKAFWLSTPFFTLRAGVCFALSLLALSILVGGSLKQDRTKDPAFNLRARRFAPVYMVIFAVVITLVAFDWVSGLTPEWYSDIFGVYFFAGSFLAGLAATSLAVLYLQQQGRLEGVRRDHRYNLGGFMFGFTVFWAYIGFAQYLLMWYGNLPEEVIYFKVRLQGGWHFLTVALAITHFVLPFFALVTRDSKGELHHLQRIALVMLCAHVLDMYWLIFPVLGRPPYFSWPELSFACFFLGLALLWIRGAMEKGEDMPVGDPFLAEGLEFRL